MLEPDPPPERPDRAKLLLVVVGSVLVTALLVALVFSLGGWAYHYRRHSIHEARLARALERHPTAADITQALLAEPGSRFLAAPATEGDLRTLAAQWAGPRAAAVLAKRQRWTDVRVFRVGDAVYFLYFDEQGTLRDYVVAGG
jgi:hypothetical protein